MLPMLRHLCRTNTPLCENVTLLMAFKATISLLGVGWACCSWAQPLTDNAARILSSTGEVSVQRSALWTAVHALHREPSGDSASVSRRLSPNERIELREQIRRAALGEPHAQQVSGDGLARPQEPHSAQ